MEDVIPTLHFYPLSPDFATPIALCGDGCRPWGGPGKRMALTARRVGSRKFYMATKNGTHGEKALF